MCCRSLVLSLWLLLFTNAAIALRSSNEPISALRKRVESAHANALAKRDYDPALLYPAWNLSGVPIDHFHNETKYEPHSSGTFNLRYYFDATYYKPGGPVIMLAAGETGVDDRLPFLQKGIVYQLAKATNGLGVLLEHRYYGTSFPVDDLTTENLRFLTTEQALADTAWFAKHVKFEGLDCDVTAPGTPWIVYGGSYAGAFVAFLRVQYPDVFFGAISSSGVTEAIYDYWAYFYRIIEYGGAGCIKTTQHFVKMLDRVLFSGNTTAINALKGAFGLQNLTSDIDFANTLSFGVTSWQGRNWDPAINDPTYKQYCGNVTSGELLYDPSSELAATVRSFYSSAGYKHPSEGAVNKFLNYIGFIRAEWVDPCDSSPDECFSLLNATYYAQDDLSQWPWRSWAYQYCDQWGYLQTGSGAPADLPPIVSRTIDLAYTGFICRAAFGISRPPDVDAINKYGGYAISYPRLAILDGQADPWREATPHARLAPERESSVSEPFILIDGAVHHWDENGLFPNETTASLPPKPVVLAQKDERYFVRQWLKEWKGKKGWWGGWRW